MRRLLLISLIMANLCLAQGQDSIIDSLRQVLRHPKNDTSRILAYAKMGERFSFYDVDSSFFYGRKALQEGSATNYLYGVYWGYQGLFFNFMNQGDYAEALETAYHEMKIAEKLSNRKLESIARVHMNLGFVNRIMERYEESFAHNRLAQEIQQSSGNTQLPVIHSYVTNATCYLAMKRPDSALLVMDSLLSMAGAYIGVKDPDSVMWKIRPYLLPDAQYSWPLTFAIMGDIQHSLRNIRNAEAYYRQGIRNYFSITQHENQYFLMRLYIGLANLFLNTARYDSSIYYANLAYGTSEKNGFFHYQLNSAKILARNYELTDKPDSTVKYLHQIIKTNDIIFSQARLRQFQLIGFSEQQRQQEIAAAKERFQSQVRFYGLLAALCVFLLIAFILYRNNRQKQKANIQLNNQKLEIEKTLTTLRDTQNQLIHAEKMASLGELTAGIAHEIQNPLNFVNNFSEVNSELFDEMESEFRNGNPAEAFSIASNIKKNLQKINEHGKRADSIVKGMLQHSRVSSGHKEPTDLNVLAGEYLRISYHGIRGRDKSFNCEILTAFDPGLCQINLVPQDIGTVLMNLYNNAFYSLSEQRKKMGAEFKPLLEVRTRKNEENIEIFIRDNGQGISQEISGKIFQPFFTTKPTGQGTGLGLSLAYDIVVKQHDGSIQVDSRPNEYASFLVSLPTNHS